MPTPPNRALQTQLYVYRIPPLSPLDLNFLAIDDVPVSQEGELIAEQSIIPLPNKTGLEGTPIDSDALQALRERLIKHLSTSPHRWIILTNVSSKPEWVLDADAFVRALHNPLIADDSPLNFCHRPIVTHDPKTRLGAVISQFKANSSPSSDAPIANRVLLLWGNDKRIITGADILGRLLKGIGFYEQIQS